MRNVRALLLLLAAAAAGALVSACNQQQVQQALPKPIKCGPGTIDTGIRCEPGSCRK